MNSSNSNSVNDSSLNSTPPPPPSINTMTHNYILNTESSNTSNDDSTLEFIFSPGYQIPTPSISNPPSVDLPHRLRRTDNVPTNEVFFDSFSNHVHSFGIGNQLSNSAFYSGYKNNHFVPMNSSVKNSAFYSGYENNHFVPMNSSVIRAPHDESRSLASLNSEPFKLFYSPTETIQNVNHSAIMYSPSFMTNTDVISDNNSRNVMSHVDSRNVLTRSRLDHASPVSSKPYKCTKCDMAFSSSQAFGGHMRSHAYWKNWEYDRKPKGNGAGSENYGSKS